MTTVESSEFEHAERWQQWQRHNAETGRKAIVRFA